MVIRGWSGMSLLLGAGFIYWFIMIIGGGGCWQSVSGIRSMEPDSEDDGSCEKEGAWGQGAGYDDCVVVLHESFD